MIDISLPLDRNLITYPGDAPLEFKDYYTHEKNGLHATRIIMESHTGTHIDAPFHAIENGLKSSSIPLENLFGACTVAGVEGVAVLPGDIPDPCEKRLIFRTRNSGLYGKFDTGFTYISMEAAEKIVEMGIEVVGIDYLSIEKFGTAGMPVHRKLLGNGVAVIEGLYLKDVEPGGYELICLPLKLDLDGAPCRAILLERSGALKPGKTLGKQNILQGRSGN